ncbi:MAG: hypothetical protein A2W93_04850 [Bacteroidetes bacterium GWF2_43_63]|nr:MAG: hypothetical protein A2W94_12840 [Bacteroidetes bacterium GWE2_42_42]OFY56083.1 MAG: hypothetical protein A2W93_04850 [Bacteroidetes bacterium GWF2_43_63]HBG70663.1 hypothetical protein [Bacteroidales bacterium]HCB62509.1 hypothetical protein [Bacteroidales bacterium]HCY21964.1 hypothetical protein [Bacteroidales bacterium]
MKSIKYPLFLTAVFWAVVALSFVVMSCRTAALSSSEAVSMIVDDSLGVDSAMLRQIAPYRLQLDSTMKEVIGYSEQTLEKGTPESLLGNFLSDMMIESAKKNFADSILSLPVISLLNNGGIRTSLPKGEVMIENVFQLMPFDNEIVLIELKGSVLMKLFDVIAMKGGMPVGGLRLILNGTSWTSAEIEGKEVMADNNYILITSDYLATGGDGLSFLSDNVRYIKTGLLVRDIFIIGIRDLTSQGKTINPKMDGRIRYE